MIFSFQLAQFFFDLLPSYIHLSCLGLSCVCVSFICASIFIRSTLTRLNVFAYTCTPSDTYAARLLTHIEQDLPLCRCQRDAAKSRYRCISVSLNLACLWVVRCSLSALSSNLIVVESTRAVDNRRRSRHTRVCVDIG